MNKVQLQFLTDAGKASTEICLNSEATKWPRYASLLMHRFRMNFAGDGSIICRMQRFRWIRCRRSSTDVNKVLSFTYLWRRWLGWGIFFKLLEVDCCLPSLTDAHLNPSAQIIHLVDISMDSWSQYMYRHISTALSKHAAFSLPFSSCNPIMCAYFLARVDSRCVGLYKRGVFFWVSCASDRKNEVHC